MTVTNKRLLISESRDDSNRCTPYKRNPDQHDTCASHTSSRTPGIRFLWVVPVRDNLLWGTDRFGQISLLLRKSAPDTIHSTSADRSCVRTQLLSRASQWSKGHKSSSCRWPTTRFTGPISPACDQYVQYLLMGANPSVLNRHRWRLQSWRCRLAIYPLPGLSNQLSPLFI
jgi:hypothetical protein